MKTKTTKQPMKSKSAVQLKDMRPEKVARGGYNPKELSVDKSVPWQKTKGVQQNFVG